MSKELVISANRHETRVAIVEDDQVVEVYHQRENEYSLAGSIHKGRVTRVLPGMQSAFVDIGLDRDAFLYVSDFFEDNEEYDKIVTSVEEKVLKLDRTPRAGAAPVVAAAAPEEGGEPSAEALAEGAPSNGASAPLPVSLVPPATAAAGGPAQEQRRDDRERDGRGRRGRRRRGQKGGGGGGRGLPDSKFYSPGQRIGGELPPRPEMREEVEPVAAVATEPVVAVEAEDLLVLPGETLAKYRGEPGGEAHVVEPELESEPFDEAEPVAAAEVEVEAAAVEEPELETPVAVAVTVVEPEPVAEPQISVEVIEVIETSEFEPQADPEPEIEEIAAAAEAPAEAVEFLDGPIPEEGEGTPAEGAVAVGEGEEGPEPARIPTSLTAALREQGPRFQHRVSRRMRRRGRDGRPQEDRGGSDRGGSDRGPQDRQADRGPSDAPRAPMAEAKPQEQRTANGPKPEARTDRPPLPSISDLLKERQEIIVQIAKEPLGQKGARITSHIALPGRFLVYMPTVDHIGVSRKIPSDEERLRLKRVLQTHRTGIPGGYIVRTAGDGRSEEELRADMMFLYNMWLDMRQKAERRPAPLLIHHDLNVVERVLRDQLTPAFKSIWVDNEELYESVLSFVQRFQPALVNRVKMYTRTNPIFDEFGVTSELEKALRPKVWLKSGGYIVINQTEALVAIDINTGKYVGKSNRLEDTIVKTNTDAIREIVRQIRLRDLGGIIVVDFIDMDERKNRQKVMQALEEAMRADRAPYKILQFNDFGLVAITRKRVKQSLERTLCTPCPYCEGAGYVKSPQTVVGEILQEAHKIAAAVEGKDVMLRVSQDVAKVLKSNQNTYLQELEEILGRTVIVKSDAQLHQEKFDLA